MTNYSMVNRTYRYMQSLPLYPFGYGLSYSQFRYESLTSVSKVKAMENLSFEVTVKNIGDYDADEVSFSSRSLFCPLQIEKYNRLIRWIPK